MTIQQLKYLIKVVECKSISKAANELYVSQPSISFAIKEIENEYGINIFIRNSNGVVLSKDGLEFLSYARNIVEQSNILDEHYLKIKKAKKIGSISTQHYSFAVSAFSKLINNLKYNEYDYILRETKTYEIIDDVVNYRSEIGIIYYSNYNKKVILKLIEEKELDYTILFQTKPYVFISDKHPLCNKSLIKLDDLNNYPFLSFEQGIHNSNYYSEELLSQIPHKKSIRVSDRATLFNLLVGLDGYTVCSGIIDNDLNGKNIIAKKLDYDENMTVIYIKNKNTNLSEFAKKYVNQLILEIK